MTYYGCHFSNYRNVITHTYSHTKPGVHACSPHGPSYKCIHHFHHEFQPDKRLLELLPLFSYQDTQNLGDLEIILPVHDLLISAPISHFCAKTSLKLSDL